MQEIGRICSIDVLKDPSSQKGQWSEEDKEKMYTSFNSIRNLVVEQVGEESVEEWMTCATTASENTFDSFAHADYSTEEMQRIGSGCYMDILRDPNSKLGAWTETDKRLLRDSFISQKDILIQNAGEENVEPWIDCGVNKSEQTFPSFVDAQYDPDGQMPGVGYHCYKTILRDPNSQLGAWSDADQEKFANDLRAIEDLQQTFSPENLELFVQCATEKAEALFPSLIDADYDTTNAMESIGEECTYYALNPAPLFV